MSAMPSTGALQAKRNRDVHSPFRNDGDDAQRKMPGYRFSSPQRVESKYTDPQRTSSSSYKPPMLRDAFKKPKAPEAPPQQSLSLSSALHYFKSVLTGRSSSQTTSTVNNNVTNTTAAAVKVLEKRPEPEVKEPPKVVEKEETTAPKEDESNKEKKEKPVIPETTNEVKPETPPPVVTPAPKTDVQSTAQQPKMESVSEKPAKKKPLVPFSFDPKTLRNNQLNDIPTRPVPSNQQFLPPTMLVPTQIHEYSVDRQWEARIKKIEQFRRSHSIIPPTVMEPETLPNPIEHTERYDGQRKPEYIFPPKEIKTYKSQESRSYTQTNVTRKVNANKFDKKSTNNTVDKQRSYSKPSVKSDMSSPSRSGQKSSLSKAPFNPNIDANKAIVQMSEGGGITSYRASSSPAEKYSSYQSPIRNSGSFRADRSPVQKHSSYQSPSQTSVSGNRRSPSLGRESSFQKSRIRSKSTPDNRTVFGSSKQEKKSGGKTTKRTNSVAHTKDTRYQSPLADDRDAPMQYPKLKPKTSPRLQNSKRAGESRPSLSSQQIKTTSPRTTKPYRQKSLGNAQHQVSPRFNSQISKDSLSPRSSYSNIHQSSSFSNRSQSPNFQSTRSVPEIARSFSQPRSSSPRPSSPSRQPHGRTSPQHSPTISRSPSFQRQAEFPRKVDSRQPSPTVQSPPVSATRPALSTQLPKFNLNRRPVSKPSSPRRSQLPNHQLNTSRNKSSPVKVMSPLRQYRSQRSGADLHSGSSVTLAEYPTRLSPSFPFPSQSHGDSTGKRGVSKFHGSSKESDTDKRNRQKPAKPSASSRSQYRSRHEVQVAKSESSHMPTREQRQSEFSKKYQNNSRQPTSSSSRNLGPSKQQGSSVFHIKPTVIQEQRSQTQLSPKLQRPDKQFGSSSWPAKPTIIRDQPSSQTAKQEGTHTWHLKPTVISENSSRPALSPKSRRSNKQQGNSTWQNATKPTVISEQYSKPTLSPQSQRSNKQQASSTKQFIFKPTVIKEQPVRKKLSPKSQQAKKPKGNSTRPRIQGSTSVSPQSSQTSLSTSSLHSSIRKGNSAWPQKPTILNEYPSPTFRDPSPQQSIKEQRSSTRIHQPTVVREPSPQLSVSKKRSSTRIHQPTVVREPSPRLSVPKKRSSTRIHQPTVVREPSPQLSVPKMRSSTRIHQPTVVREPSPQLSASKKRSSTRIHQPTVVREPSPQLSVSKKRSSTRIHQPTVVREPSPQLSVSKKRSSTRIHQPTVVREPSPQLSVSKKRSSTRIHQPTVVREPSPQLSATKTKSPIRSYQPSVVKESSPQNSVKQESSSTRIIQPSFVREPSPQPSVTKKRSPIRSYQPSVVKESSPQNSVKQESSSTRILQPSFVREPSPRLSVTKKRSPIRSYQPSVVKESSPQNSVKQESSSTRIIQPSFVREPSPQLSVTKKKSPTKVLKPTVIQEHSSQYSTKKQRSSTQINQPSALKEPNSQHSTKQQRLSKRIQQPTVVKEASPQLSVTKQRSSTEILKPTVIIEPSSQHSTKQQRSSKRIQQPTVISEKPSQRTPSPQSQRSNRQPQVQASSESLSAESPVIGPTVLTPQEEVQPAVPIRRRRRAPITSVRSPTGFSIRSTTKSPPRSPLSKPPSQSASKSPQASPKGPSSTSPSRSNSLIRNASPTVSGSELDLSRKSSVPSFQVSDLPNSGVGSMISLDKSPSLEVMTPSMDDNETNSPEAVLDRIEAISISPLSLESLHFENKAKKAGLQQKVEAKMMNNKLEASGSSSDVAVIDSKSTSDSDKPGPGKEAQTKVSSLGSKKTTIRTGVVTRSHIAELNVSNSASSYLAHSSYYSPFDDQSIYTSKPIVDCLNMDISNSALCNTSDDPKDKRQLYKGLVDEPALPIMGSAVDKHEYYYDASKSHFIEKGRDSGMVVEPAKHESSTGNSSALLKAMNISDETARHDAATGHSSALRRAMDISDEVSAKKPKPWHLDRKNKTSKTSVAKSTSSEKKAKGKSIKTVKGSDRAKSPSLNFSSPKHKEKADAVSRLQRARNAPSLGGAYSSASNEMVGRGRNVKETNHDKNASKKSKAKPMATSGDDEFSGKREFTAKGVMSFFTSFFKSKETAEEKVQETKILDDEATPATGAKPAPATGSGGAKREYSMNGYRHSTFQESLKGGREVIDPEPVKGDDLHAKEEKADVLPWDDPKNSTIDEFRDTAFGSSMYLFDDSPHNFAPKATMMGEMP